MYFIIYIIKKLIAKSWSIAEWKKNVLHESQTRNNCLVDDFVLMYGLREDTGSRQNFILLCDSGSLLESKSDVCSSWDCASTALSTLVLQGTQQNAQDLSI